MVAADLRKSGGAAEYEYDAGEFRLDSGDGSHQIHLTNVYREYQAAPVVGRRAALSRSTRSWLEGRKGLPEEFGDAAHDLLPIFRSRSFFEVYSLRVRVESGTNPEQAYELIADHFGAGLVYDLPNSMLHLDARQLSCWGVSRGEAMSVALDNLRRITEEGLHRLTAGIWQSPYRDNYDACRILLPGFIEQFEVSGDPVVMTPNRDTLLLTGSEDEAGLARLAEASVEAMRHPRALSAIPLRLGHGSWRPYSPPPDHPQSRLFRRMWADSMAQDYVNQEQPLRALHLKEGKDIFVAGVLATPDLETGDVTSGCVWIEGVDTLLPRTEVVHLFRPTCPKDEATVSGRWERVCEVVGDLLEPAGLYPERYRVRAFPSEEQFRAIAAGDSFYSKQ